MCQLKSGSHGWPIPARQAAPQLDLAMGLSSRSHRAEPRAFRRDEASLGKACLRGITRASMLMLKSAEVVVGAQAIVDHHADMVPAQEPRWHANDR